MRRQKLEVADIFHRHGAAWRKANAGHVSLGQLQAMSAIENCRSAALGGHVERCQDCGHRRISYNSCRNRHCPKCQGAAARDWLVAREADLLPVGYFHLVFTLPAEIAPIAYQNKAVVYDLLFRAAAETLLTIAADPKHLGARIGATAVLHSWGSAMTHHPHLHMIVPGGGISLDGTRWVPCRPGFLLPVRVLSRLFGGSSWPGSPRLTPRAGWPSLVTSIACATGQSSPPISRRCGGRTGSSTPSRPLPGPRRYSPTLPATPTALLYRTAASLLLTSAASPSATRTIVATSGRGIAR